VADKPEKERAKDQKEEHDANAKEEERDYQSDLANRI